jgi:predicted permease
MMRGARRRDSLSTRAFLLLLGLYPAAFRDEYGREIAFVFIDRYRHAPTSWDRIQLWFEAATGILIEAPKEHLRMISQDLRYACRVMRQHALITTTIIVTLGTGIGANTAVFSVLNAVALRNPLGVPNADQLYTLNSGRYVASGQESSRFSGPMFDVMRRVAPDGVGIAAMSRGIARVYTRREVEGETTRANLQLVSPGFFAVLGIAPAIGRTFTEQQDSFAANEAVAVLSDSYWRRRFGGSPDVIGRVVSINGAPFTIVGVGPRQFVGVWLETPVDIWVPLTMQAALQYSQSYTADGADLSQPWLPQAQIWWLHVVARVPRERVSTTVDAFNASLSRLSGRNINVVLEPFARGFSQFRQQFSTPLVALMVMSAIVLFIACLNVANVLLARAVNRLREIAIRRAIGAGRARLFHQLLTESALLVLIAGGTAVLIATWAGDVLIRLATATANGSPPFSATVDLRVLGFAAGLAFLSLVIFGVWPAWRSSRVDLVGALKSFAPGVRGAARPARLLVIVQVALSLVLVTGAGLFVRSFQNLLGVGLGYESEHLLTVGIDPRFSGVAPLDRDEMYRRLLEAVTVIPGVRSASLAMCGLQNSCARESGMHVEGYGIQPGEDVVFSINVVTRDYISTVGMPLLAGRPLSGADLPTTPHVALVNKTLATRYFGDWRQAIGRRFGVSTPDTEIVGVVDDARALGNVRAAAIPSVFVPYSQRPASPRTLEVRTSVDPRSTIAEVRRAIGEAAPNLPIEDIEPVAARIERSLSQERLVVVLTAGFSALALGLAGLGFFGVLSYAVARRTSEIGLRMALGASRSRVVWNVVRDGVWLVIWGFILGFPLTLAGGNLVSSLIFGVSPYDAPSMIAAAVVLLVVGTVSAIMPALRAARVDPMITLRQE